jgi:hypothetical protein
MTSSDAVNPSRGRQTQQSHADHLVSPVLRLGPMSTAGRAYAARRVQPIIMCPLQQHACFAECAIRQRPKSAKCGVAC